MTAAVSLDPRTKLFLVVCLSTSAVVMTQWLFLSGLFLICILLLLVFGINPFNLVQKTKILLYMVLVIALMQSIFAPSGQILFSPGGLVLITSGGLIKAGEFILRMLIIVASASLLSTSSSREIIQGMVQWKLPYELAFMASMGIRFLPVFANEFRDAMIAVQLRGVDIKALPFRQKLEVFTGLFQPVAAGALIKARAISMSIEMRGFRAYPGRTSYLVLQCRAKDYAVMIIAGLLTSAAMISYFQF